MFIISQSNETSSVVHDINIAQNYSEPYNNWDEPKSELWKYICRILKINNIILRNAIENPFVIVLQSVDPNLVGAPPKTVSLAGGEGWGHGMKKQMKCICPCFTPSRIAFAESGCETVSLLRLGMLSVILYIFFVSINRLFNIHITRFNWFLRREGDSTPH